MPATFYTEYPCPRRDEWATKILSILKTPPIPELTVPGGLSRRAIQMIRAGRTPQSPNKAITS